MRNLLKYVGGLAGALTIGALGSGLWELFFSPMFGFVSSAVTGFLSSLSQSYSDSIYAAASVVHGSKSIDDLTAFVGTIFSFSLILYGMHIGLKTNFSLEDESGKSMYSFVGWVQIVLGGVILSMCIFQSSKLSAIRDVRGYSLTHMNIARPYVGDSKYHYLMSEFLMVDNEAEFEDFVKKMRDASAKSGVEFEEYRGF